MSRQPTASIRIIVADDHPIVRHGLRNIVEDEADLSVAGEAGTADEVLAAAERIPCDVILLDLSMPGAQGLDLLKALRRRFPAVAILVLSIAPESQFAVRALQAGAAGYITKRSAPDLLVDAIRHVVGGGVHFSLATGRALADEALRLQPRRGADWTRLSVRENEILRLLASGLSATTIGRELGISVKTVSTHRTRMLAKLDLESTAALIRYALNAGVIER